MEPLVPPPSLFYDWPGTAFSNWLDCLLYCLLCVRAHSFAHVLHTFCTRFFFVFFLFFVRNGTCTFINHTPAVPTSPLHQFMYEQLPKCPHVLPLLFRTFFSDLSIDLCTLHVNKQLHLLDYSMDDILSSTPTRLHSISMYLPIFPLIAHQKVTRLCQTTCSNTPTARYGGVI